MTTPPALTPEIIRPPWTVLLIGGSSGTGKTTLARAIGRVVGAAWSEADDFRLVLQRLTTSSQQPALHAFLSEDIWSRPPEELRDLFIAVGDVVSHALEIVVANHVATDAPLVLEGDGILPSLAAQATFAGHGVGEQVRAVFLHQPDEANVLRAMASRGRGLDRRSEQERWTQARASWLYGQWIESEAERLVLPTVETQPWSTLIDRVMRLVGLPRETSASSP